jgi:hypothetical protein
MFARAIREGVGHDGRPLHPQMWYDGFRYLSDEDVESVVVFLRTIPAVKNRLPPTRLAKGRKEQIEKSLRPLPSPNPMLDQSTPEKRGRYLTTIANCQGCHTAWEAPKNPGRFGGGNHVELEIGGKKIDDFSHNLTPDPTGIPYYDDALFIEALRTGRVRTRDLGQIMPWTVFRNMTDSDLKAIHAYLKTLLPVAHLVDAAEPVGVCPACGQTHGGGALNRPRDGRAIPIDPAAVKGCEGTYHFADFTLTLSRKDGKLLWDDGGGKTDMKTDDNRIFYVVIAVEVIEFVRDASGRIVAAIDRAFDDERARREP